MKALSSPRFLTIYSGVLTLAFMATVLCGIAMMRNPHFGIITARRINIIEPDGTVRLTVSNRADFPGSWIHKQESPRPDRRDAAGMLFMTPNAASGRRISGRTFGFVTISSTT